jgi:hypothetical protein
MSKTIVHILPQNSTICGGIKIHYYLSELERELGYDSYIAYPNTRDVPNWFKHKCTVIDYQGAKAILGGGTGIVVGWEDMNALRGFDDVSKKVCFVQGEVFVNRQETFKDIHVWYSSKWNQNAIKHPGPIVSPFVDPKVFYPAEKLKFREEPIKVLLQERKDGRGKTLQVLQYIEKCDMFEFKILPDVYEVIFAEEMRQADIFFAHSFPEGFGLPALEAMASKTLVVGYTGGGGTDFMLNSRNCYCTRDGNAFAVANSLVSIAFVKKYELYDHLLEEGYKTATETYSRARTKVELQKALALVE